MFCKVIRYTDENDTPIEPHDKAMLSIGKESGAIPDNVLDNIPNDAAQIIADTITAETQRLEKELGRAYRALAAFALAHKHDVKLNDAAVGYHCPTSAAAKRFTEEGSFAGADYFEGKPIEELHKYL